MKTTTKEVLIGNIMWNIEFTYGYNERRNRTCYSLYISKPEEEYPVTIMLYSLPRSMLLNDIDRTLCIENSSEYNLSLLECKRKIIKYLLHGKT